RARPARETPHAQAHRAVARHAHPRRKGRLTAARHGGAARYQRDRAHGTRTAVHAGDTVKPFPGPMTDRASVLAVIVWAVQGIGSGALSPSRGRAVIDCAKAWLWVDDV